MYRWWGLAALACLDAALVVSGGSAILSAGKPGGRQGGGAGYTNDTPRSPTDWHPTGARTDTGPLRRPAL